MFSSSFASCFAGVAPGYICPVMAQAAVVDGKSIEIAGSSLVIDGRILIGPAGKVFAFGSPVSALKWVEVTRNIGVRERAIAASMPADARSIFVERKAEKLALIAARLIAAAAKVTDAGKRAALVAESEYCLSKWA